MIFSRGRKLPNLTLFFVAIAMVSSFFNACGKLGNLQTGDSSSQQNNPPPPPPVPVSFSKVKLSFIVGADSIDLANYVVTGTPAYSYSVSLGSPAVLNNSTFNPNMAGTYKVLVTDSKGEANSIDLEVFDAKVAFDFSKNTTVAKVDGVDNPNLLTFTRNDGNMAIASYINNLGQVKIANASAPRFNFDPVRNISLGLYFEKAAQNLVLASSEYAAPNWTYGSADPLLMLVTLNAALAPDGLQTAENIDLSANMGTFVQSLAIPATVGTMYTGSVWLKGRAVAAQTHTLKFGGTDAPIKGIVLNNAWQRVSITGTATLATMNFLMDNDINGNELNNYSAWGAQVEVGSKPSSYMPTTTAAVSRGGDMAKITQVQNFDSTKGVFVLEFVASELPGNGVAWLFGYSNGEFAAGNVADGIFVSGKNNLTNLEIINGGVSRSLAAIVPWTVGTIRKIAFSYSADGITFYEGGTFVGTITGITLPLANLISLGYSAGHGNGTQSNDHIRSLKYYPLEGTAKDLQRLSL